MKSLYLLLLCTCFLSTGLNGQTTVLSMNDAVSAALRNSPDIKKAQSELSAVRGRYLSAISLPQPSLSVTYEEIPSGKQIKEFGERSIELSQEFDFPTSIYLRGRRASRDEEIATLRVKQTELSVAVNVRRAYIEAAYKTAKLKYMRHNTAVAEEFMNKALARYNSGEAGRLEYLTAKLQNSRAAGQIETAQTEAASAMSALARIISGSDAAKEDADFALTDTLQYITADVTFEDLAGRVFSLNPAAKISGIQISAASIDHSLAWSSLLPSFSIGYNWQTIENNSDYYGISLGISVPLWFMFDQRGRIQEAKGNLQSSRFEMSLLRNQLMLQLKNAWSEYRKELRQAELYRSELLPQSLEVFNAAKANYESGEISYMEFLVSKQTFADVQNEYIDVLFGYNTALLNLEEVSAQPVFNTQNK